MVHPSIALAQLGSLVDEVATQEEIVLWSHSHGITHKDCGIQDKCTGHGPTDGFRVLLQVIDGRDWDTKVRDRSPEVCREEVSGDGVSRV